MLHLLDIWRGIIADFLYTQTVQWHNSDIAIADIGVGRSTGVLKPNFPQLQIIDYAHDDAYKLDIVEDIPQHMIEKYDVVSCCEVLEHTINPFKAADGVMKLTKPGGTILLTVPCKIHYHPMKSGDYWRFFESTIPLLFTQAEIVECKQHYFGSDQQEMPVGVTAVMRKPK
jgi:2-polyprenyl-3-methyl-5-hydroxy-6-metoxy-1,4-benzoquinol methylase